MEYWLITILSTVSIVGLIVVVILVLKYGYNYPCCPECGDDDDCFINEQGNVICKIHGPVTGFKIIDIDETEE
ncbi:hypothetical protein AMJ47_03025 [Parcubacteria bacterium DG_72]|nr:MAG: hypothetical protein AMJ47_03025 [Parcubacteria bacterium DG_72]